MQSNNPVFRRSEAFNGTSTNAYGNQTYPGNGTAHQGYGQGPGYGQPQTGVPTTTGRAMTVDSVVQKTGIALAVVIVFATLTWWYIGDVRPDSPDFDKNIGLLYYRFIPAFFDHQSLLYRRVSGIDDLDRMGEHFTTHDAWTPKK